MTIDTKLLKTWEFGMARRPVTLYIHFLIWNQIRDKGQTDGDVSNSFVDEGKYCDSGLPDTLLWN